MCNDNQAVDTIELDGKLKGYTVKIFYDIDPMNPRDWDNLATMACYHPRYNLGDKLEHSKPDDLIDYLKSAKVLHLPLYLYDHSGIWMSTDNSHYPFNDYWDSGQVGYIYVPYDKIYKEFGCKQVSKKLRRMIYKTMQSEVEIYNFYISNQVYGYQVYNAQGKEIDSCYGYYGSDWKDNGLLEAATDAAEYDLEHKDESQ